MDKEEKELTYEELERELRQMVKEEIETGVMNNEKCAEILAKIKQRDEKPEVIERVEEAPVAKISPRVAHKPAVSKGPALNRSRGDWILKKTIKKPLLKRVEVCLNKVRIVNPPAKPAPAPTLSLPKIPKVKQQAPTITDQTPSTSYTERMEKEVERAIAAGSGQKYPPLNNYIEPYDPRRPQIDRPTGKPTLATKGTQTHPSNPAETPANPKSQKKRKRKGRIQKQEKIKYLEDRPDGSVWSVTIKKGIVKEKLWRAAPRT